VLGSLAGREVAPQFQEDATLKSGLCLMAGAWVLMANLRDELNFFTSAVEHG
jgi:F-type H+-transporting ATPase subunit b